MYRVTLRFYEELNDFLPPGKRKRDYTVGCEDSRTVKDLLEAEGVPHPEIDLILVNGESVGFDYLLQDGDRISVYPMFERFDIEAVSRLGRPPLREARFVADVHMGKLVRNLRLLGFDVRYDEPFDDERLAQISHDQRRILLTRDKGLLKRSIVDHGIYLRSDDPTEQAKEVVRRLQLREAIEPASRCLSCNGDLEDAAPESVKDQVPPDTYKLYSDFKRCRACGKVYWQGAHWDRLQGLIDEIAGADADPKAQ